MQIKSLENNSFGQIIACNRVKNNISRVLAKKDIKFADDFKAGLKACRRTNFADLEITSDGKVFVVGKESKQRKKIDSFSSFIENVRSGIKHVLLAEDMKIKY